MASKTSKVCSFTRLLALFSDQFLYPRSRIFFLSTSCFFLQDNGLTPLMLAARDNKHNIVEKLLELGAVVTDRDKVSTKFVALDTLWLLIRHCFSKPFFNYTRSPSNDLFAILLVFIHRVS